MTELSKRAQQRILKSIAEQFLHNMLAKGGLTESDLCDRDKLIGKALELVRKEELEFVIDHRESILSAAEEYLSKKKYDFSIIFYAMFFEHSINNLITHQLEKKKFTKKAKMELIRSVNMEGKFSWLLELLEMPKFNDAHKKIIIKTSSERNAFIHYKWNPIPDDPKNSKEEETLEFINIIRKSITYIKRYESLILYKKSKGKLKNALNKRP